MGDLLQNAANVGELHRIGIALRGATAGAEDTNTDGWALYEITGGDGRAYLTATDPSLPAQDRVVAPDGRAAMVKRSGAASGQFFPPSLRAPIAIMCVGVGTITGRTSYTRRGLTCTEDWTLTIRKQPWPGEDQNTLGNYVFSGPHGV